MRIAYVCADRGIPVFGCNGPAIHVEEMIRALRGLGHGVDLFAAKVAGRPPADLASLHVEGLATDLATDEERAGANDRLRAALVSAGPYDLIYERYSLWSFAAMEYAREIGVPGILEVNAPLIDECETYRGRIDRAAAERVVARAFTAATLITTVSRELAPYASERAGSAVPVHVVPNAVSPRRFAANGASTPSCAAGGFTIGFLGSMKPWHGLPTLVEAFALVHRQAPESRLLMVGDGPERERTEAALAACGVRDAVTFTGAVPPSAVPGLLGSMDTAVAPYPPLPHFYFSPLKVFEYMAAGVATVASQVGQLSELICDGVTGLLCTPADAVALATCLERLRRDADLRRRLGRAARAQVLRAHTWEATAERVLRLAVPAAGRRSAEAFR